MTAAAGERVLTSQGARTRARIVEAAAGLVAERGVAATSMDDVRTAAKVSSSQIYHYFADKQALVRAVVAFEADRAYAAQAPMLARLDSVEGFRSWRNRLVRRQRQLDCRGGSPLGTIGAELAETDEEVRADVALAVGRWEDAVRTGLRAMLERRELPPDTDPDALAAACLAALQGGLLLTQLQRRTAPLEAALDTFVEHLEILAERAV